MKHLIKITVNNLALEAFANVHHTSRGRELESVTAPTVSDDVLAILEPSALSINDVLFLAMAYYLTNGKGSYSFACGPVDVQCRFFDLESFRQDLDGKTYMVKITDVQSNRHLFDVGAPNSLTATIVARDSLHIPTRSTVTQPLEFLQ